MTYSMIFPCEGVDVTLTQLKRGLMKGTWATVVARGCARAPIMLSTAAFSSAVSSPERRDSVWLFIVRLVTPPHLTMMGCLDSWATPSPPTQLREKDSWYNPRLLRGRGIQAPSKIFQPVQIGKFDHYAQIVNMTIHKYIASILLLKIHENVK